ncbi:MAG: hypothetical protein F6K30_25195, partial [Cyanothece sp. SIO2G6]|nr:hypothetical protein [Cyanothece sp. SIO2G6]
GRQKAEIKAEGRRQKAEENSKSKIQNPKSKIQNSLTLYKTGDRALFHPDGTIEYLGRIDNQVKLRGFRIELGEIEAALMRHPDVGEAIATLQNDDQRGPYLVAHVTLATQQATLQNPKSKIQNLRSFLKSHLPSYMVPAAIVPVETFPLTVNGKIDRKALPKPDWIRQGRNADQDKELPHTNAEQVLATIWAEVLGVEVGIRDNFFELGGDSILSIQIIARAKQAGLTITPRQLFQHQTVAELAAVAVTGLSQMELPEQGAIAGSQQWPPIYHWFFEQNLPNPHHYNQSLLLDLESEIEPERLARAWAAVVDHHDALRLRFEHPVGWDSDSVTQQDPSQRRPLCQASSLNSIYKTDFSGKDTFLVVDMEGLTVEQQDATIATVSNDLQSSLNLSDCLCRCVLFHRGVNQKPCLLIIVHHLVIDGLSWRVLLADLELAYHQQQNEGAILLSEWRCAIALPPKTTSFQAWGEALVRHAQSSDILGQHDYWQQLVTTVAKRWSQMNAPSSPLQPQSANSSTNSTVRPLESTTAQVTATLDKLQTQNLLVQMPSVFNTRIDEVLLTALVQTLGESVKWSQGISAEDGISLVLDLEGHGRDVLEDRNDLGLDMSRTLGWFTSIFPVMLTLPQGAHPGDALKSVKEQLRQIPASGTGYGLLRYLHPDADVRQSVTLVQTPGIKFNYLGQLDLRPSANALVKGLSHISPRGTIDPKASRLYALEINSFVQDGRLQTQWNYSREQYSHQEVEHLAQRYAGILQSLIRSGQARLGQDGSNATKEYTPSDFAAARLNQQQLDQVLNRVTNQPSKQGLGQNTASPLPMPQQSTQTSGRQRRRRR